MVSRSTGQLRKLLPAVAVGLVAVLVGCGSGQVTQTASIRPAVNGNQGDVGDIALRDVMIAYPETGTYRQGDDAPLVLTIVNTGREDDELVSVTSPAVPGEAELVGNPSIPGGTALQVVLPAPGAESAAPTTTTTAPSGTEASGTETSGTETSIPEESITDPQPPGDTGTPGTVGESGEATAPGTASSAVTETQTTAPLEEVGTISVILRGLVQDLPAGRNFPVTFVFANAGQITLDLPIASPATARPDPTGEGGEGGH